MGFRAAADYQQRTKAKAVPRGGLRRSARRPANVHVVVVPDQDVHHALRPAQLRPWTHEDELGAGVDEAVDEVLRELAVHLLDVARRPLAPVATWPVEVDVAPVLVRGVSQPAVVASERPAGGPREVADSDACRRG